ncbi:hypothetical protein CANARDRAFT_10193 [[Candida] arabinofermentans NRRL YB-2248]|uniref:Post-GPI attachment to proteins factor 3 n=1 Tax=[Candida] arabinofermentans NRRL YB-2248 TaxID=983967 RepID=A0A1E4STH6_9ASCO|nr:hypothetical protein CANARDRAFT_10193 [[Candida] arabinofermentans NRRL YB-2248]
MLLPVILLLFTPSSLASIGDDLSEFQNCVSQCDSTTCLSTPNEALSKYPKLTSTELNKWIEQQSKYDIFTKMPLSAHLSLLGWSCYDNCDYQCQRIITKSRIRKGQEVVQFHGKWPFLRIFGIQELFSTLFSMGNFYPNYKGFKLIYKYWKREKNSIGGGNGNGNGRFESLYFAYLIVSIVSCLAWVFSSLFHLKDNWNRERLDYFFAGMTVLSGFYGITMRVFKLYTKENANKRKLLGIGCIIAYICHVSRLLYDWSYTYNMEANVICGLIQNVLWIYHSISTFNMMRNRTPSSIKHRRLIDDIKDKSINWTLIPLLLVGSVSLGMSFELFDFPPIWDLIDAHAMWHLATIWPALFWYSYMIRDVEECLNDTTKLY